MAALPSRRKAWRAGPSSVEERRWLLSCLEILSESSLFSRYFTDPTVVSALVFAVAVVRALSPCGCVCFQKAFGRFRFSVCVVSTAPELRSSGETFTYQPSQHGLSCSSPTTVHPSPSLGMCTARSHNLTQK